MKKQSKFGLRRRLITAYSLATVFLLLTTYSSSYFLYRNSVISTSETQMEETSTQVLTNYEYYFEGAVDVSSAVEQRLQEETTINKDEINVYFDLIKTLKTEINDIALYSNAGNLIVGTTGLEDATNKADEKWFEGAQSNQLVNVFSSIESTGSSYFFTLSKYVSYSNGQHGVINFTLDFTKAIQTISDIDLGEGGHVVIYDKNYNIVYKSGSLESGEIDIFKNLVFGTENVTLNKHNYFLSINTIYNTTWRLAMYSNVDYIEQTTNLFLIADLIISISVLVIIIMIIIGISNSITRPIYLLRLAMNGISKSGYINAKEVHVHGSLEVEDLAKNYNQMIKRISTLMDQVVVEQNLKRKSELRVLQNQINPHFLYNTLDSIIYEVEINENDVASRMIMALSKFFRISLSKGKTIIPIKDEVEHVRNYLLIQVMRLKDKFTFDIDVDNSILNYEVVKLILQPIVENAVIHGIKNKSDGGHVSITGKLDGEYIKFIITDNGFGILDNKIQEIYDSFSDPNAHKGVGIKNVYQRLRLYYGENADVRIESELDCGTTIMLIIPLSGVQNNEE